MRVAVLEAGKEQSPAGVDRPGARPCSPPRVVTLPYEHDALATHSHRFGLRVGIVRGPDVGVDDDEVGALRGDRIRGDTEKGEKHHR